MSPKTLHLSTAAAPTLFQTSTHLAGRLFSVNGAAAIAALALVILFVFLLHIYAKRFLQPSSSAGDNATSPPENPRPVPAGLDDSAVASIPCFVYDPSTWQGRNGSECVVCLSEFEEKDEGRVLPQCGHCFHVACIDRWLRYHCNCPICRAPIYVAEQGVSQIEKGVNYGLQ